MIRCPRCNRRSVRVKVEMFLDIPAHLEHALNKTTLRDANVRLEGVNWPKAWRYCAHASCGWVEGPR